MDSPVTPSLRMTCPKPPAVSRPLLALAFFALFALCLALLGAQAWIAPPEELCSSPPLATDPARASGPIR